MSDQIKNPRDERDELAGKVWLALQNATTQWVVKWSQPIDVDGKEHVHVEVCGAHCTIDTDVAAMSRMWRVIVGDISILHVLVTRCHTLFFHETQSFTAEVKEESEKWLAAFQVLFDQKAKTDCENAAKASIGRYDLIRHE